MHQSMKGEITDAHGFARNLDDFVIVIDVDGSKWCFDFEAIV